MGGNFYDSSYTWDHEGRMSSLQWPAVSGTTGPLYQYQFDAMGRVYTMVDSSSGSPVATSTYTVANQLLGLTYFGMTENRDYNSLLQLTGQSVSGTMIGSLINLHCYYPYGANNGLISSSSDSHLGETMNYTYDSLNHLSNVAASTGWSQAYKYDGFGNMTYKQGAGPYPDYHAGFDWGNHQVGMGYDANGNQTSNGTYDVSNRLVTNTSGESYAYDYRGKRIVKWLSGGGAELSVYGIDGKKLTTMVLCYSNLTYCGGGQYNLYFKGKLIQAAGHIVVTDRAGSVRWSGLGGTAMYSSYYPYGEERTPTTADDQEKFGTYTRDNPGQDYADQRYYGVGTGRFLSADPGGIKTAKQSDPRSWNRNAYVEGDPVNFNDPVGLFGCQIGGTGIPCDYLPLLLDLVCVGCVSNDPLDPPPTPPQLNGDGVSGPQKNIFAKSIKDAESKLKKANSQCQSDFGPNALATLDSATYNLAVIFVSGTTQPNTNVYAATDPGTQTVTINSLGFFFNILPTPIPRTNLAYIHDMNTGLGQTDFDAFVLLHELGHLTGVLGDDRNNTPLSDAFNKTILKDCFGKDWTPPVGQ